MGWTGRPLGAPGSTPCALMPLQLSPPQRCFLAHCQAVRGSWVAKLASEWNGSESKADEGETAPTKRSPTRGNAQQNRTARNKEPSAAEEELRLSPAPESNATARATLHANVGASTDLAKP